MNGQDANAAFGATNLYDVSFVTALVTGGGSGIGLVMVQALVKNGAKVYITGRRKEVLNKVKELYSTGPGSIHVLPGDITQKEEVQRLAAEMTKNEPNGIQLLVNNAGTGKDDDTRYMFASGNQPPDFNDADAISEYFMRSKPEQWETTMKINVEAQYFMSVAFLPLLAKGQKAAHVPEDYFSSIVNVSSIAGTLRTMSGGQPSYTASKAAILHLSRNLAYAFSGVGVRVNLIAPGLFASELTADDRSSNDMQKSYIDPKAANPRGRKGKEEDMAGTILFLAGIGGAHYNNQILYPDGGVSIILPGYL